MFLDKLNERTEPEAFVVEKSQIAAYAAATNDPIPEHVSGEIAPPVFSVVPAWSTVRTALMSVTPPEAFPFIVHGEQDMYFHHPVVAGTTLQSSALPIGVHVKPTGTTVVVLGESRDEQGTLISAQYFTAFFRGISDGDSEGVEAPNHKLDGTLKTSEPQSFEQTIDTDQTHRYAEASGDNNPIHLDEAFAQSVGLPGKIVHGLCTMAFLSWGIINTVADGNPARLQRLAVRFSRPVLPGQTITTDLWAAQDMDNGRAFGFETRNPDGKVVIKDGRAELAAL